MPYELFFCGSDDGGGSVDILMLGLKGIIILLSKPIFFFSQPSSHEEQSNSIPLSTLQSGI